jgi:tRNA 2-thiouridine synthesizing protein A
MTGTEPFDIARYWHASEAGCGALIMGLKRQIERIEPGELLQVTALDAAASIDIAAWCQMTGHMLVAECHPTYILERRMTDLNLNS